MDDTAELEAPAVAATADAETAGDAGTTTDASAETKPVEKKRNANLRYTDEQITEMRHLRSLLNEEGKVVWTHMALAKKFGTTAGIVSQIVRNRSYKDPNYIPVNDGK